jgi:phosphate-selective porin O/P
MKTSVFLPLLLFTAMGNAQQLESSRINELEQKLDQATRQLDQLNEAVQSLRAEIAKLKGERAISRGVQPPATMAVKSTQAETALTEFAGRIIEPEMGAGEREETLRASPEVFIQSRYSALPIRGSNGEFEPNLSMTRIETRCAEELVNDAFVEYYLNGHAALRVGQFIKPFGFDIQQSSAVRESPERGVFAGYFFPGQRDRGVMLFGDLNFTALKHFHYFIGAFNGNRFFRDNNRQANYVLRVRKLFDRPRLVLGFSAQRGKQILPPGVNGDNDENLIGMDFQYAVGRLGLRGEIVAGNTPSTLLGIEPEFAGAFRPGAKSAGGNLFATYRLTNRDHVYARYDQFNRDPVKGYNVRAFNLGYLRYLGEMTRIGFDYQFKNRPSFNDDALNGRFHITWGVEF